MRIRWIGLVAVSAAAWGTVSSVHAEEGSKTSARTTAELGFAALRKAAAEKDEQALVACLPAALVKDWREQSKDEAKAWRAALAARIADGKVVSVKEDGDNAIARWTAGGATWELRLRLEGGRWIASAPWAYCVAGGDVAKANAKDGHVKLKARTSHDEYGASGFSFAHVTQDPKACNNRIDAWYCTAGHLHASNGMISALKAKKLDEVDGFQKGGDWMDQAEPRAGRVYVVHCSSPNRRDFQVALLVTAQSDKAMEFDWRVVAAGIGAPASVRTEQPLVSRDGADGCDGFCGK